MKSLINHEKETLVKTVVHEKAEISDHAFQNGNVNHRSLNEEMQWLQWLIEMRCRELFLEDDTEVHVAHDVPEPTKLDDESPYSVTINTLRLTAVDRVILALGIASSHYPSILKTFVQIEESSNAFAIEAGGEYNKVSRSFKPTFQTALFLLAGKDLSLWSHYSSQLINGSVLLQNDIIYNRSSTEFIHGKIELDTAYLNYFLSGQKPQLDHGSYFPGNFTDLISQWMILFWKKM